ncbi:MAG: hypothetical protein KIH69_023895 [Anaerolineae bacterium]|nr:hypothetical protein [Anaerolineae bacterium]
MASAVVEMDYGAVEKVAKGFDDARETLEIIKQALEAVIQSLQAASFVSFGTSAALAQTLKFFQDIVKNLIALCKEFAEDLRKAVNDHKRGDYKAGSYFKKGISL